MLDFPNEHIRMLIVDREDKALLRSTLSACSPITIDTDYFGKKRNKENPTAGPFERPGKGDLRLKVWQGNP